MALAFIFCVQFKCDFIFHACLFVYNLTANKAIFMAKKGSNVAKY